jgi:murein DD-endopeptidase MepM/ murein hydrolase activator NlpD
MTRRGRLVVWVLLATGLQAIALGLTRVSGPSVASVGLLGAGPAPAAAPEPLVLASPSPVAPNELPMSTIRGVTLHVPGRQIVAVAYHEASRADALALHPSGRCVRNANRTKFDIPRRTEGPDYIIMSSRGRPHPATSAVDVAMPSGSPVLAPVTGKVIGAKKYYLYGRYLDYRVDIRPDDNAKLRVVTIHLDDLAIRRGDRVTAGVTWIGVPRLFSFHSQINNYIAGGIPHVHIEVKRVGA